MEKIECVYESFIRTTPEKLWAAITQPEFTRQYWGGGENISTWKKGSSWEHVHPEENNAVCVSGEVLESVPPKRLVLSWNDPENPGEESQVSFEIEPIEDMVRLKVVHGGLRSGSEVTRKISWGWPRVLSSVKSFLETGKPLNVWAGHETPAVH